MLGHVLHAVGRIIELLEMAGTKRYKWGNNEEHRVR